MGNLYIALDIPYADAYHDFGYSFCGFTSSSNSSMKFVPYMVNGLPVNQTLISNIQNFSSNMVETHVAAGFNVTGNVGIGTSNPGAFMLAVNGNVHAKQVNIDMNSWSDYVFKSNYPLPTLTELKTYIDQNHHLPEIPSEQQIEKDGLNLGEMNKLLVKKVEELTLYLIEKDKEIKDQQILNNNQREINQSLQKEMNELKQQVSTLIKVKQ